MGKVIKFDMQLHLNPQKIIMNTARTHLPKDGDIMIRLTPHPKGSAKAVVSLCSVELSILKNKMVSSRTRSLKDGNIIELSTLKNKMVSSRTRSLKDGDIIELSILKNKMVSSLNG